MLLAIHFCVFGQSKIDTTAITDPVALPYFVIHRKSPYVSMPDSLGSKQVNGFAGVKLVLDSKGGVKRVEILRLQVSGKTNISYEPRLHRKTVTIAKYESFLKKYAAKIKVIKTDRRNPPRINTIIFVIRF